MEVRFFDEKVEAFVKELDMPTSAKVFRMFELLERFGHLIGLPHSRSIGRGLFELRARGMHEVRLLYAFRKGAAVLLHGFIKKSQKIPPKEIEEALRKLSTLDS